MANRADKRKFHYIYKITRNDGSGKYYIGMHSTDNLDDGYFGSGKILWKSIEKHGKDKHSKTILEYLPSRAELKTREKELVNEELLTDALCMNLKLGGNGGGKFWSLEHQQKAQAVAAPKGGHAAKNKKVGWFSEESARKRTETRQERIASGLINPGFSGKSHTEETKIRLSEAASKRTGAKNSQFGTCWVNNKSEAIKIKLDQLPEFLENGFQRGRSLK